MSHSTYETQALLEQYLLFHYGNESDLMPFSFGPKNALHFPVRCVTECLNKAILPNNASALDLGCAVGRSTFELAKSCAHVIGVDRSQTFISAAKHIQEQGQLKYTIQQEGTQIDTRIAKRPDGVDPSRIEFQYGDAMDCFNKNNAFDVVLAGNLICRLTNPTLFLTEMHRLVNPQGQLILTSPYSWLEEHTPQNHWFEENPLKQIESFLKPHFKLERAFDMPFLIREHLRKYQWSIAQASIWKRIT